MMKRVHFPIRSDDSSGLIVYPDQIRFFANADLAAMPGHIIADYSGSLDLPLYGLAKPAVRPLLVITQVTSDQPIQTTVALDRHEVICPQGATLSFTAELRSEDGAVLPLSDSFRLPIRQQGGRDGLLLATMVDGIVKVSAPFTVPGDDGTWMVNEAAINAGLPEAANMRFAGITVSVFRT
ncbi:hypothetical protein FNU76_00380 [Chitinimonas arctica]|uniref:Uncharacterized protein n=1 Tax=Chitinimonas arctica TaxID=2594795 RepID=A0A516S9U4_9NEIS|nr:hypothetical protein [Chitinimonas arctica]QDQ24923.1 hypothetical protein FNU76_00380 [Chitinimonas arctica]